jgi:hypothetical protein
LQVFKINSDFNYLSFFTDPDERGSPEMREMLKQDILLGNGTPRAATWRALPLYAEKKAKLRGNFAHLWGLGKLAIDSRASELLKPILRDTCELLPFLPLADGEVFHRFNLLAKVDCLDKEKTKWFVNKSTGAKTSEIEEYHFHPSRFEKSSLFLLPKGGTLFAVTGTPTPEFEFKTVVEREGLTGLKFEAVWSEGGQPIRRRSFFW